MGDESRGDDDPLKRVIDEIRLEVDGLLGEEIARLLNESGSRNGNEVSTTPIRAVVSASDGLEVPKVHAPLSGARDHGPGNNAPAPWLPGGSSDRPDADDARQRLDNLARRLESRLRRSRERATERGASPDDSDSSEGLDDRHSDSGSRED